MRRRVGPTVPVSWRQAAIIHCRRQADLPQWQIRGSGCTAPLPVRSHLPEEPGRWYVLIVGKNKMLPAVIEAFLQERATASGVSLPDADVSLFDQGILDSFSLLDLVERLEQYLGTPIPDSEVHPANFATIRQLSATCQRLQS